MERSLPEATVRTARHLVSLQLTSSPLGNGKMELIPRSEQGLGVSNGLGFMQTGECGYHTCDDGDEEVLMGVFRDAGDQHEDLEADLLRNMGLKT
jgi:hypothetical protein